MPRKTRKTVNKNKKILDKLIKREQRMQIREDLVSNYWECSHSSIISAENDNFIGQKTRGKSRKSREEINRDYYNHMKTQNKILIKREKDRLYQRRRSQNKEKAELKRIRDRQYQAARRLVDKIKKSIPNAITTTTTTTTTATAAAGSSYLLEAQRCEVPVATFEFIDINSFSECSVKTENSPLVSDILIKKEPCETTMTVSNSCCDITPVLGYNIEIVKCEIDSKTEIDGTYTQIKTEFMSDDIG